MSLIRRLIVSATLVLPLVAGSAIAQEKSLYLRLGGYDAVAAIVDDFGMRLAGEERFKRFFAGHSKETQIRQRQLVVDLICQLTGGPCFYIGRELKAAHAGLGISQEDWVAAGKLFGETLAKLKVGEREQQDLNALIAARAKDIVDK